MYHVAVTSEGDVSCQSERSLEQQTQFQAGEVQKKKIS